MNQMSLCGISAPTENLHLETGLSDWFIPLCRTTQPIRGPPVGECGLQPLHC